MHRTPANLIRKRDLGVLEQYFIGETQPYLLGMHEMTIVDLVTFFAVMAAHQGFFDGEESRRVCPKISRWAERLMDNEDLLEYLQKLKLDAKALEQASEEPRPKL